MRGVVRDLRPRVKGNVLCNVYTGRGRRNSNFACGTSSAHPSTRQTIEFSQITPVVPVGAVRKPMGRSLREYNVMIIS